VAEEWHVGERLLGLRGRGLLDAGLFEVELCECVHRGDVQLNMVAR
jgi:hypothetical protein